MVLVTPVAELNTVEQLIGDIRIASGGAQCWKPIETGYDSILNGAWLDMARPARDAWHAEAALTDCSFGLAERRHPAIRPGKHFRTIVGSKDDDRVVCLAHVIQVFQQCTDVVIQIRHPGLLETIVGLAVLHRLVFVRQKSPDVHPRSVMPDEERLAPLFGLIHKVTGSL